MQINNPEVKILKQLDFDKNLDKDSNMEDISKMQGKLFDHILEHLENCNKICLKDDLKESVQKGNNLDILEHGTIYLTVPIGKPDPNNTEDYTRRMQIINFYQNNPESVVKGFKSDEDEVLYVYFITTNYRVIVENNRHNDLIFLFNSSEYHSKRTSYSIVTNLYTANKLSKIKYLHVSISDPIIKDDDITIISHSFDENTVAKNSWINSCKELYKIYEALIDSGLSKSNAFKILPNTVKVNVVLTAFDKDFEMLFKTLDTDDDIDYCDVVHMIAYDHDNSKIIEEVSNEVAEENSKESGESEEIVETEGNTELSE